METETKFQCQYCRKTFARETSLAVHVCEQKKRRQERNERGVELGFQAYLKFYETTQGSSRLKTYDDFCESSYYKAFVRYGRYCVNTRVINPTQFLMWLLKQNKKIDQWASDTVYTQWLQYYLLVEHINDALSRSIEYAMDWAEQNSAQPQDCLRYGNHNRICHAIVTGRVSPWAIYNSESGQRLLTELSTEQLAMIWPYIDSDVWQKKFADYPADQAYAQDILSKAGW